MIRPNESIVSVYAASRGDGSRELTYQGNSSSTHMTGRSARKVPGQKLIKLVDGMLGNAPQDFVKIGLWIHTVEFGGADEGTAAGGDR